jgi:hypothetical protein
MIFELEKKLNSYYGIKICASSAQKSRHGARVVGILEDSPLNGLDNM